MTLLSNSKDIETSVLFADKFQESVSLGDRDSLDVYSPIFKYNVRYNATGDSAGYFNFVRGNFNPAVLASGVCDS